MMNKARMRKIEAELGQQAAAGNAIAALCLSKLAGKSDSERKEILEKLERDFADVARAIQDWADSVMSPAIEEMTTYLRKSPRRTAAMRLRSARASRAKTNS